MIKNIIAETKKVDYVVLELDKGTDIKSVLGLRNYEIKPMNQESYVQLVDDEYYLWMDPKHYFWNLRDEEEIQFDATGVSESLHEFRMMLNDYKVINIKYEDDPSLPVDIPIEFLGDKMEIIIRSETINELGFDRLLRFLSDLRDVATISRIDLANDFYFRSEDELEKQKMDIVESVIENESEGYAGTINQDDPITFTGFASGNNNPAHYIGDQNNIVNLKFYNPIQRGVSRSEVMRGRLKLYAERMTSRYDYPKTDYGDMVENLIDDSVSMYQQRYINQFNILRFDMTLTGVVADNAFNYIFDTDKSEEDIVKHLLEKTSDEYFGFER